MHIAHIETYNKIHNQLIEKQNRRNLVSKRLIYLWLEVGQVWDDWSLLEKFPPPVGALHHKTQPWKKN